jgi:hypothetical protein
MKQIWKDIPGYEWFYKVSDKGRVYSYITKKYLKWRKSGSMWHLSVVLFDSVWSSKDCKISRLVACAFLGLELEWGDPKTSLCACHKDDRPANNKLDNIFLGTNKENNHDMWRKWRKKILRGKDNPNYWKPWSMLWKFGKDHHLSKPVLQLTMSWEILARFNWCREAWRETWVQFWDIAKVCMWYRSSKTAGWYKWKYV